MAIVAPSSRTLLDGQPVQCAAALPDDAPRLLAYLKRMLATSEGMVTLPHEYRQTEATLAEFLRRTGEEPEHLFLVATLAGAVVGHLSFQNDDRQRKRHVGTFGMSVGLEYRGRGIGTLILQELIAWAAADPVIEKIALTVFATNAPAIGLYRKLGFSEEGRRPRENKIGDDEYVDDLLMYRFV